MKGKKWKKCDEGKTCDKHIGADSNPQNVAKKPNVKKAYNKTNSSEKEKKEKYCNPAVPVATPQKQNHVWKLYKSNAKKMKNMKNHNL